MLKALADFLAQFDFATGSSAAINAVVSDSAAAIEKSFGFESSLGQIAVTSIGRVGEVPTAK
ncbi:hypothetical protein [Dietzia sp. 179-F 9C3 NHS]|uniref:hypothetical protein n=1 Tax=Dietzia sp. 179-F 9C3 NHS TaxID=3374295 RepID=UPI00387A41CB